MRYGIIDLGSNTVRLVVYKYTDEKLKKVYTRREVVGLASYILPEGYLSDIGINAAISIVAELKAEAEEHQTDQLFVIATAAIRNARNQNEIVNRINQSCGVKIQLLSGEEEARVGVTGINYEFDIKDGVVIDIGGGSTEVSILQNRNVELALSLPVGSLNSYITFVKEMLPTPQERNLIKKGVSNALLTHQVTKLKVANIYGIGGTLKAAKTLLEGLTNKKKEYLTKDDVTYLIQKIDPTKKSTYLNLIRLAPERFHTIVPGLIILETIFEYFDAEKLYVGKNGIREGYILEAYRK